ncbi:MAG: tetratricopeptide repeat protein [Cyanobacteria bacterium J06621_8]
MFKVDEVQSCLEQAQQHWQSQQWQETIQACAKALALDQGLAQAHKLMGDALLKTDKAKEAVGYYQQAVKLEPNFVEVYANLGTLYAMQQQWSLAIANFQQALKIDPEFTGVYRHLVRCQLQQKAAQGVEQKSESQRSSELGQMPDNYRQQGQILEQQGRIQEALAQYTKAAELEPQNKEIYQKLVRLCEHLGNWSDAANYCRIILELSTGADNSSPSSLAVERTVATKLPPREMGGVKEATTHYHLGDRSVKQQDWNQAIKHFQRAIALEPKMVQAHLSLARALTQSGQQEAATKSWLQGISLDAAAVTAPEYLALGDSLVSSEEYTTAVSCYRRAIKQQPDLIPAYLAWGALLTRLGQVEQAIACYIEGLKQQPHPQLYFSLGSLYQVQEKWAQAKICYQKATQADATYGEAYHQLGEVLSHQEQWAQAVQVYRQAIGINPDFSWSYNNLGYALIQLEQWEESIPVYQQAVQLNPDFPWAHYNLAEAHEHLSQWSPAISSYQRAVALQPDLPQAQQKLGEALYRCSEERRQQAIQHFLLAIKQDPDNPEVYHRALAIDKHNINLYLKLGGILVDQGQSDQAIAIYQMALQLQPKNSEILARLHQVTEGAPQVPTIAPSSFGDRSVADYQTLVAELQQILPYSKNPSVSIIIPVYNQLDYTLQCLKAIAINLSQEIPVEIIVVNDCSSDATESILTPLRALNLVKSKSNQGFIHSCNHGASLAKGEYLYFLNNDTEIQANCIASLVAVLEQDPEVGAVGSKLLYPQGSLQEAGGIIWQDASGWNYGRQENSHDPRYNYLRPVDYCSGASLMVRRSIFKQLNGFEQDFAPAYYEDTDLCFAIRHQLGMKVMYQPQSSVIHYEGISSGTSTTSGTKRYQVVNAAKFRQKWQKLLQQEYLSNTKGDNAPLAARKYLGKQTILVIDSYMPSFDRESGSRRLFGLLKILKSLNYHVIFAADNGVKEEPYVTLLQSLQIETLYTQDGYGTVIEEQIKERLSLIDLAWICRPELNEKYAPLIRQRAEIKLIYDTIDLHYLRLKRAWELSPDKDAALANEWIEMQSRELKMAHQADLTITVTATEQQLLQQQAVQQVSVIPNIHHPYQGDIPGFRERSGILFIGSYNHPPNIDAVLWLCQEIMPLVWQQAPQLKVTLLGNNPSSEISALQSDRIAVTGYIEDVSPYFLSHQLSVSPLRYGAGMKGKIGHSLEYGLPVVSTSIGTEGMNLIPNQHILLADNTEDFARQILLVTRNEPLWQRLSDHARSAITPYTSEAVKVQIEQTLRGLKLNHYKFG